MAVQQLSLAQNTDYGVNNDTIIMDDPLEEMNRAIFVFNSAIDKALLRPLSKGYDAVTPNFVQDRIGNFLEFITSPITLINNVLQGDIEGAHDTGVRILVNGTIGLFGFIDIMEPKIAPRKEDFGQTLAVWGVESGPYLVLPFFGPSSFRDGAGMTADMLMNPVPVSVEFHDIMDESDFSIVTTGLRVLDFMAQNRTRLEQLEGDSLDYYSTIKSLYSQKRANDIGNRTDHKGMTDYNVKPRALAELNDDGAIDPWDE